MLLRSFGTPDRYPQRVSDGDEFGMNPRNVHRPGPAMWPGGTIDPASGGSKTYGVANYFSMSGRMIENMVPMRPNNAGPNACMSAMVVGFGSLSGPAILLPTRLANSGVS